MLSLLANGAYAVIICINRLAVHTYLLPGIKPGNAVNWALPFIAATATSTDNTHTLLVAVYTVF